VSNNNFTALKERLAQVYDLNKVAALLSWDESVTMPRGGAQARAEQTATVGRLAHELFVAPEVGRMLDDLQTYEQSLAYDSDEASLIRVTRYDYEKARRIPTELRSEMARVASLARSAWGDARERADFKAFQPLLQQTIDLKKRYVDCMQADEDPYAALLDDYERGMSTAEVRRIFDALKEATVPLIAAVAARGEVVKNDCLTGDFPVEQQRAFCLWVLQRFGYSDQQWRLDPTAHPFSTNMNLGDIRLTTRYNAANIAPAVFGVIHEFGHGLYEHGVSQSLERTPLCGGTSLGLHESQSRLWENLVGRSRAAWTFFLPELKRTFPGQLRDVEVDTFYRAVNKVQPGLIRVEADELTYPLHVVLRFELEQEMLAGTVKLDELPDAWNSRMKEYLGVEVPDAAKGVLQDVHWSLGLVGYFPTYVIGSIESAQIWEKLLEALPDLPAQIESGEFTGLREWLRDHLHRHGRKFTPKETLQKVVGTDSVDVGPYVAYLRRKFGEIYSLS
jgi:carboxypeptidase Taq